MKRWLSLRGWGQGWWWRVVARFSFWHILVSLISFSSTASLAISAAVSIFYYGPPPCKSGKSHD